MLLLPALVAARSLADDARPDELQRLERVVRGRPPAAQIDSAGSRLFHRSALSGEAWPASAAEQHALLVRARLAQVFGVAALGALTYLTTLLARGRLQALFACALFASLPPVTEAGHVLRPETPATMFAMLSLLLLQFASRPIRRQHPAVRLMTLVAATLAAAMACEALPSLGEVLMVPGVVLMVAAVHVLSRAFAVVRRRSVMALPIRAVNRRLLPWTGTALLVLAATSALLLASHTVPVDSLQVTARQSSLVPDWSVAAVPTYALVLLGLLVGIGRVGLRLGRGGRIGPDLILFVFCALFLIPQGAAGARLDPLPQAPAMAVVLSEGVRAVAVLLSRGLVRRRG